MRRLLFRLLSLFRSARAEHELAREINAHLQLLQDEFIRQGMDRSEAHHAARRAFGGQVEQVKERQRDARSFRVLDQSWLDLKLALRMLVRYRGVTIVSVLGMAVSLTIAAGAFTIVASLTNPALPFAEGDRIVAIGNWDNRTNNQEPRVLHELVSWKTELRTVEDVGAFRHVSRNLITPGAPGEMVAVAEISASAFRVTRVGAAMGRPLIDDDERVGAAEVVVIGDGVWRRRFEADPHVLGRELQLGSRLYTIVGVMPPGFRFPAAHSLWVPLRVATTYGPPTGPSMMTFARLTPGATLDAAQAEVATLGRRLSEASPATHQHLRARILPYTHTFTSMDDPDGVLVMRAIQSTVLLLLLVVCVNVAILVYARTATRQAEIAVRSALGASRRRIVWQLCVEALALAGVAALVAIGLLAAGFEHLDVALRQLGMGLPFWLEFELSAAVVLRIGAFTVFGAAIVGVVPALKATGRRVQTGLAGVSAGSGAGMQMGRMWTLLIVAQVAITVAVLPATVYHSWRMLGVRAGSSGFAAGEFLITTLTRERRTEQTPSSEAERQFRKDYGARLRGLARRLEAEPAVSRVTFSLTPPGGELAGIIEVEGVTVPSDAINYNIVEGARHGHLVRFNRVSPDYFDAFDVPILMGRSFQEGAGGSAGCFNASIQ